MSTYYVYLFSIIKIIDQTHQMAEIDAFQITWANKSSRCFTWIILFIPHRITEFSSVSIFDEEFRLSTKKKLSKRLQSPYS